MTSLLLLTHGHFGESILETAFQIVGAQQDCLALPLEPEEHLQDYSRACQAALLRLSGETLILVDALGGTPWNVAVPHAQIPSREIFGPLSLPVLLEALSLRGFLPARQLARELCRRSQECFCGSELIQPGRSL